MSGARRRAAACALLTAALGAGGLPAAFAQDATAPAGQPCAPVALTNHIGPFDYVTERGKLDLVEQFHFTPRVEALVSGQSGYLGHDLSYTLNAFPNHHRALVSAMNYALRTKKPQPPHLQFSVDCYFDRAIRFRPKDTVVRGLFAIYLGRLGQPDAAVSQLAAARAFAGDDGLSQHNIGLVYLEMGLHDQALAQAHLARKLGFEGTKLADALKAANRWKEPTE